jgi:hypothetical protein
MANQKLVLVQDDDQNGVNARLIKREHQADYSHVEGASVKVISNFASPEGKRLFLRTFATAELQFAFISNVARKVVPAEQVDPLIEYLRYRIDDLDHKLNSAIDSAEAHFKRLGVTGTASYDLTPLQVEVPILTAQGRRLFELMIKFDQFMPLLQTLIIHDVINDHQAAITLTRLRTPFVALVATARRFVRGLKLVINGESPQQHLRIDWPLASASAPKKKAPASRGGGPGGTRAGANRAVQEHSPLPYPEAPVDAARVGVEKPAVPAQPAGHYGPTRQGRRRVFSKADRSERRRDDAATSASDLPIAPDRAPDTAPTVAPETNGQIPLVNGNVAAKLVVAVPSEPELHDAHAVPSEPKERSGAASGELGGPNGVDVLALK